MSSPEVSTAPPPPFNWTEEMEDVLLKKMKQMSKKHQSGTWWTDASWEIFQNYMNKRRFHPNLSIPQLAAKMREVRFLTTLLLPPHNSPWLTFSGI
jgi:hypothetical protein